MSQGRVGQWNAASAGARGRVVVETRVLQHKLSAREKAVVVHAHNALEALGAGSGNLRVRSVHDLTAMLFGIGSASVTRYLREARETGAVSDPKPAGRPPLKFPPEVAGPLVRRYMAAQRKAGQPVTVAGLQDHLLRLHSQRQAC